MDKIEEMSENLAQWLFEYKNEEMVAALRNGGFDDVKAIIEERLRTEYSHLLNSDY